jgi:hypothetical protein
MQAYAAGRTAAIAASHSASMYISFTQIDAENFFPPLKREKGMVQLT